MDAKEKRVTWFFIKISLIKISLIFIVNYPYGALTGPSEIRTTAYAYEPTSK